MVANPFSPSVSPSKAVALPRFQPAHGGAAHALQKGDCRAHKIVLMCTNSMSFEIHQTAYQ
jgi:hypothetical protein